MVLLHIFYTEHSTALLDIICNFSCDWSIIESIASFFSQHTVRRSQIRLSQYISRFRRPVIWQIYSGAALPSLQNRYSRLVKPTTQFAGYRHTLFSICNSWSKYRFRGKCAKTFQCLEPTIDCPRNVDCE